MAHPVCCPVRIDRRRLAAAATLVCALISTGCSREPAPETRRVEVVPTRALVRPATAPIARSTPTPVRPASEPPPRRAFVDPPLPPELVDPPGLVPLPPRPTFADNHQGGMP